jgi:hypothetical protein
MIAAARERGWTAEPSPHLAFRNASPTVRLYMAPHLDAAEYARRWEEGDLERVGAHAREYVSGDLWPWLKSRAYVTDRDDPSWRSGWTRASGTARRSCDRGFGSSGHGRGPRWRRLARHRRSFRRFGPTSTRSSQPRTSSGRRSTGSRQT